MNAALNEVISRLESDPTARESVMEAICGGPGTPEGPGWFKYPHPSETGKHLRLGSHGAVEDVHGGRFSGSVLHAVALSLGLPDATGENTAKAARRAAEILRIRFDDTRHDRPKQPADRKHRDAAPSVPAPSEWWRCQSLTPPDIEPFFGGATNVWLYPSGLAVARCSRSDGSKTYQQATKRADDNWKWGGQKGTAPLYCSPFGVAPDGSAILIHEGEKAADAGAKLFPAWCHLTAAGGSQRIPNAAWGWLAPGSTVYLLPDGDDSGRKCMEALAARLHGMGHIVHLVPDLGAKDDGKGKDAADWRADDPDGFREKVTQTEEWEPPADPQSSTSAPARPGLRIYSDAELRAMELPPAKWILPDILPEGLGIISGPPKSAKSAWAVALADCVAGGAAWFMGKHPERGGVIYVDVENGPRRNQDRARTLFPNRVAPGLRYANPDPEWLFDDSGKADIESLMQDMAANGFPVRLVVLDTLEKTVPQPQTPKGQKLDRYQSDTIRIKQLKTWANSVGVCLLLVHHGAKSAVRSAQAFDSMSGSVGVTAGADSLLTLTAAKGAKAGADSDADGKRLYTLNITGKDVPESELAMEREGWRWRCLGPVGKVLISDATQETVSWIADNPGCSRADVYKGLDVSKDTGKKRIQTAIARGLVEDRGNGLYAVNAAPWDVAPLDSDAGEDQPAW